MAKASYPAPKNPITRLLRLLKAERKDIGLLYLYAIFAGIISLSLPLGVQAIFNFVSFGKLITSWIILMVVVISGLGAGGVLQVLQLTIVESIQRRVFVHSAFEFAFRIPKLAPSVLQGRYVPELVNRFFDTLNVQKGLAKLLMDLPSSFLQIVFGLILLSLYHPLFLVFGLAMSLLLAALFRFTLPQGLRASLEESKYKYQVAHWLEDLGRSLDLFKLFNHTNLPLERTNKLVDGYLGARKKHFSVLLVKYWMLVVFKVIIIGTLLILGSILVQRNEINMGQLVASEIVIILLTNSIEKLVLSLETVYDVLTALEKIGYVTDMDLEEEEGHAIPPNAQKMTGFDIRINDLQMYTPTGLRLLDHFSAHIRPGEIVRLSGCSSASTQGLLEALIAYRTDYGGNIAINGISLKSLSLDAYRKAIAPVFSDREIFDGTLLENIMVDARKLGEEEMSRLMNVLKAVGLDQFVEVNEDGLETRLMPQGEQLAGSIRRKIVLSRALMTKSSLIILHSPFGGLTQNESKDVLNFIRVHQPGITVIIASDNDRFDDRMDAILDPQCSQTAYFPTID